MFPALMLIGCSLLDDSSDEAPVLLDPVPVPSVAAPPAPSGDALPKAQIPAPQRPPGCHHFFSESDATQAFAVASEAPADCAFEGVRVRGDTMDIRYKPDEASEVRVTLRSAACEGEGEVVGGLRLTVPDEARRACPKAVDAVRGLSASGSLPTGTEGTFGE